MSKRTTDRPRSRQILPITLAVVAVVAIASAMVLGRSAGLAASAADVPTVEVRRGPLTISVVESGAIKSKEQVSLKSEVEGQTTIIYLIPEGTEVKKGDLLVELDASNLEDARVDQQIRVQNAEAAFIQARENLAVVKNQADSDISVAELDYQFAQEDVTKYVEGEYPQQLREAESRITLAHEEMERASQQLEWSERLYQEKYISQTDLAADRLSYKRAELDHELAVAAEDLLENYTHKRQLAQLNSDVEQTQMALERAKLRASADIVQAGAELSAKESEFRQQQSKLEKVERQITKTKIFAPRDGLAVYATSAQGGRHRRREPLEEGQAVRERQELIYLPSADSMMAEVQIHESSLEKVRVGLNVRVSVDALPGQTFMGRVGKIAPLPDAQSAWLNPDLKVYPMEIYLEGRHPELRTGMSCQAEIMVEKLADATYVPIQAVVRRGARPTVYVRAGGGFEPHPVEIGLDNNSMVHIASGLEAGEIVSLAPPLDSGTTPDAVLPGEQKTETEEPSVVSEKQRVRKEPPRKVREPREARGPGDTRGPDGASIPRASEGRDGHPPSGDLSEEERAARRERFRNMSPEEREAMMRERMKNMSPEQREAIMERMRQRRGGGGGPEEHP
ncbi:MAG: efflux RND transporter periplasmic adaptor subunit [Planctomycetota bacterium]|jgi:HlyD family secretion protein